MMLLLFFLLYFLKKSKRIKKLILSSILSTDMEKHEDQLQKLKKRVVATQICAFEKRHNFESK